MKPNTVGTWLVTAVWVILARVESRADAASSFCPPTLSVAIPSRAPDALTGSEFARKVSACSGAERDAEARNQLLSGDVPSFLRRLAPVTLRGEKRSGERVAIVVCVMPDYLAVGSDDDFLRIPMGLHAALAVGRRFDQVLPTTKIVDAIELQAVVRLAPQALTASPQMRSTAYVQLHDLLIDAQERSLGYVHGALAAGHKKDLVLTNRLWLHRDRVAIYGWHRLDGEAIQPLSTRHGLNYADYSHGVRLVSQTVYVNGIEPRSIFDVLEDRELAPVLSDEGVIHDPLRLIEVVGRTPL